MKSQLLRLQDNRAAPKVDTLLCTFTLEESIQTLRPRVCPSSPQQLCQPCIWKVLPLFLALAVWSEVSEDASGDVAFALVGRMRLLGAAAEVPDVLCMRNLQGQRPTRWPCAVESNTTKGLSCRPVAMASIH